MLSERDDIFFKAKNPPSLIRLLTWDSSLENRIIVFRENILYQKGKYRNGSFEKLKHFKGLNYVRKQSLEMIDKICW